MEKQPLLILAPIRGVTNFIYRNALNRQFGGVDSALAPYIVTHSDRKLNARQLKDLDSVINDLQTTAQVLTKNADEFLEVAKIFKTLGVQNINLNMGCPYPMVANRLKGSGLLTQPKLVNDLLSEISKKCSLPFSVKLRLGREDRNEIDKLIPIINELKIETTIHPRLGKQLYKGSVDLEAFEILLEKLNIPPCYNGDIENISDFLKIQKRFPTISKWMIGRGALNNPALFSQIKGKLYSASTYKEKLFLFHQEIAKGHLELDNGHSDFLSKMKGQWFYLSNTFSDSHKVMKKIKKSKSIQHYQDSINWIFEQEISKNVL